jgi:hypothetical protein
LPSSSQTDYAPGIGKIVEMPKEGWECVASTSGKMIETIKTALDAIQTTVTVIQ